LVPPREQSLEVPVPIRVFLDRRRIAAMFPPAAFMIPMGIGLVIQGLRAGDAKIIGGTALVIGGLALPIVILLTRLRSVLKRGYRTDDIAVALRTTHARHREEFLYEFGQKKSLRESLVRGASIALFAGAGAAVVAMIAGGPQDSLLPLACVATYAGVLTSAITARWTRFRNSTGSFWARMWHGKFGRVLARATAVKPNERAIPTNRPTELAIAMSAESLFVSFPKDVREALGDVPKMLRTLEAHAQAARARIEEVDATLAEAQHTVRVGASEARQAELMADLRAERTRADDRLAEVVTALENVRLDLLRIHAGTRTAEGITQDLEAARALGEDADRLIAGVREAEATLKR
jgi:serine/threonine-protein kinase